MAQAPPQLKAEHSETNSTRKPQITVEVSRGNSPADFDIVIASYASNYSGNGPLGRYVANELGLEDAEISQIFDGKGHRILSVKSRPAGKTFILGQVVSISTGKNPNAKTLQNNLRELLIYLIQNHESLTNVLGRPTERIWFPMLGTGSAGLGDLRSARIIASVMSSTLTTHDETLVSDVVMNLPVSASEETIRGFVEVFRRELKTGTADSPFIISNPEFLDENVDGISEMPDRFHSDHALKDASQDDLGRDAIAEAIATNVTRVWALQKKEKRPFAIHLSGRWGSGKSSILGFLGRKLAEEKTYHPDGWVIVDYNAWKMQEAGPPWWSLLTTVREQGYAALGPKGRCPRFRDWVWRNTRIALPWILTLAAIALLIGAYYLVFRDGDPSTQIKTTETTTRETISNGTETVIVKSIEPLSGPSTLFGAGNVWAFVLTIITGLGSIGALTKIIQSWSKSTTETAEAVRDLHSDPTAAVKARFERVIQNIDRPVAVFIDDLDRCDARFVVDLLQSLQTAYANVAVLYVVASDRDWIVSAYNQIYDGFTSELTRPGAPLGYQFVKKIFQLSVSVPDLAASDRIRLAQALLKTAKDEQTATHTRDDRVKGIRAAAAEGDLSRISNIQAAALAEGQNLADEVMRAVTNPDNQNRLTHKLLDYSDIFDGNPRAIKRLINALTFRQGYILTAAEDIPFDTITRWTILALRFPYTADVLAAHPRTEIPSTPTEEFPSPDTIRSILKGLRPEDFEKVSAFG